MTDIASTIRAARLAAPMTQDQLARGAGVTRKTVVRAEQGHPVAAETLMALCSVLCLDAATLAAMPHGGVPGPSVTKESLVAMVLRGDETEERCRTLTLLAGEAVRSVPGVVAIAATDILAWERRTLARLSPEGAIPDGTTLSDVRPLDRRQKFVLLVWSALTVLIPSILPILLAYTVTSAELGVILFLEVTLLCWCVVHSLGLWTLVNRLNGVLTASDVTEQGVGILSGMAYAVGETGLYAMTLDGVEIRTVHVPPEATTGCEVRTDRDGLLDVTVHMISGREVPQGYSWTLETLGEGCREMAMPCLRTGPAFEAGLAGYRRVVRTKGVQVTRTVVEGIRPAAA